MVSAPVWPIVCPIATVVVLLLLGRSQRICLWINLVGSVCLFIVSLILLKQVWENGNQVLMVGDWKAPFGIALVADSLSSFMVSISSFVGACISLYLMGDREQSTGVSESQFGYFISVQTLLVGVNGSFLSGDFFNLYVWFEVMLISSFVLIAYERRKEQIKGAFTYTLFNLTVSLLLLTAVALLYTVFGSLNMADLAQKMKSSEPNPIGMAALALLLISFGAKAGVFPLFAWLPASYHTPRTATSALLAGLLTKVGVYALIRTSTLMLPSQFSAFHQVLIALGGLTMFVGVLGAVSQFEIKRILSFHIISQIGYMVFGLALHTSVALAATFFYVIHHILVKTNLFLVSGLIVQIKETTELNRLQGLASQRPLLAVLFMLPALSLAGLPPFSGFFAKVFLLKEAASLEHFHIFAVALLVSLMTLISMTKIWVSSFWGASDEALKKPPQKLSICVLFPVILMVILSIGLGIWPDILLRPAIKIGEELMNPSIYINSVLGEGIQR